MRLADALKQESMIVLLRANMLHWRSQWILVKACNNPFPASPKLCGGEQGKTENALCHIKVQHHWLDVFACILIKFKFSHFRCFKCASAFPK
jgi:hypothetical protein